MRQNGEGGGWAVKLLNWMNTSWPHRGHKLYNMGEPGADVIPTLLSCPQTLLGGIAPDLVLVDVTVNGPEYYERLLRLLLTSWAPPPAVVFTLFGVCHTGLEPRNSRPRAGLQSTRVAIPWTGVQ